MIISVVAHAFARPFEDYHIDVCEFFALVATLFIYQSGVVYKILADPESPDLSPTAVRLATLMERTSMVLVMLNIVLALIVEVRTLIVIRKA